MWRIPALWLPVLLLAVEVCHCEDVGTMLASEEVPNIPLSTTVTRSQILSAQFECYLKIIYDPPRNEAGTFCNRTWDGWLCWDDSAPGTAMQLCPVYFQDFDPSEKVTKVCNSDGQWFRHPESNRIWSNYTQCQMYTKDKLTFAFSLYYLAIVGHGLSVVSLIISLCIFSYFKSLSCQRNSLHKNMFLSFIFNSICTVIWLSAVANNQQLGASNPIGCKILAVLNQYTFGSNYFWMLCEGIYLHTLIIVAVFVGEQQLGWYYVLGWGFPIIPAITHAVARGLFYDDRCWISSDTHLLYIIHGPVHAALLVNLFFLLNIVRVLITKLQVTHSAESNAYMKVVRATLILIPLLGAQFILVPWRPEGRKARAIYEFIMNIFTHFQGLLVAIIFCFYNAEVQACLRRKWAQTKLVWKWTDSYSHYHTNSSVTETSRATVSLELTAPEGNTIIKPGGSVHYRANGQSNGKRCTNGEMDTPRILETTDI
ncbi:calcitonin gene-related peptide type 1 receptor [Salmo salar]|uniref:Calcitonin gene-related peptide type 1 receptor-like n=1 Tax=Salmo salar TaxID=8030 RepID=A0A1S3LIZ9_SALSA|nr:calcitonin gene-related peptide type 1 receptor-like [Salmo salar]XP_013990937.1 calcitonin gene-related peptide type 1 receptor-like [Salmo salar]|eukprot:XP_013990936.1 PREDICTED: calcitonin gene-related peptide type 1 receptor-like [Salmo salar]